VILFLLTFFLLYGGLHAYLFVKAQAALALSGTSAILLILFLLLMVLSPLLVYSLGKYGFESSARLLALVGFSWMGLAFICFCCFFAVDFYRLIIFGAARISSAQLLNLIPSARYSFFIILIFALSLAIYGFFKAEYIRTERVVIKTSKIPKESGRLKIVQISDVHLGLVVRKERLARILQEVIQAGPDIFVSAGDLVDGQLNEIESLIQFLQEINPRYGKFAVTGNHEFYAGLAQTLDFTRKAGFTILRGEGLTVAGLINIAGVDDPAGMPAGLYRGVAERELLSRLPREKFTVLLKHRPHVEESSLGLFDLQISGHTHKGQIFPFRLFTRLFFRYVSGDFRIGNDALLHVSRGSGTWGPPIRLLAPPEVTVYELVPEGGGGDHA